jgi:hypothetical protein
MTFQGSEEQGGRSFNLATHEIPIREIPTRSESSDRGEVRTVRLGALKCLISEVRPSGEWEVLMHKLPRPKIVKSR